MRNKETVNSCFNSILRNILLQTKDISIKEAIFMVSKGMLLLDDLSNVSYGNYPLELINEYANARGKVMKDYLKSKKECLACDKKMNNIAKCITEAYGEIPISTSLLIAILFITGHANQPWLLEDEAVAAKIALKEYSAEYEHLIPLEQNCNLDKESKKSIAEITLGLAEKTSKIDRKKTSKLRVQVEKKKAQRKHKLV